MPHIASLAQYTCKLDIWSCTGAQCKCPRRYSSWNCSHRAIEFNSQLHRCPLCLHLCQCTHFLKFCKCRTSFDTFFTYCLYLEKGLIYYGILKRRKQVKGLEICLHVCIADPAEMLNCWICFTLEHQIQRRSSLPDSRNVYYHGSA